MEGIVDDISENIPALERFMSSDLQSWFRIDGIGLCWFIAFGTLEWGNQAKKKVIHEKERWVDIDTANNFNLRPIGLYQRKERVKQPSVSSCFLSLSGDQVGAEQQHWRLLMPFKHPELRRLKMNLSTLAILFLYTWAFDGCLLPILFRCIVFPP